MKGIEEKYELMPSDWDGRTSERSCHFFFFYFFWFLFHNAIR